METVVVKIRGCCCNSFSNNSNYDSKTRKNSFSNSANYDKYAGHYYCCFGGCYSTGTESESLKLLWRELEDVAILKLSLKHGSSSVKVGGCCSTGAESEA
uniref:Ovule protein n=1 Tax=Strongyloides stercoralis TaxID=6248 RepID=A0A0K0EAH0_STRER